MSTYGWNQFENIVESEHIVNVMITVSDEGDTDLTDKVNIVWYDADGKQIGTGNTLRGLADSTVVYYSVLLEEELGRVYREVKMQKIVASDEPVVCQLEKIGRVTLSGRVSAADIDRNTVAVNVRQMLNGKWEQEYTTQTNEKGEFSVEVYDDETDITFCGDGYLNATIRRDGFNANGNIGTIPMNLITGFAIAANVTIEKAAAVGEAKETGIWSDGLNNIEFVLENRTKGNAITDFTVQNGSVIVKSGAAVGDGISLTAKSKQGVFADATTTFTIVEGTNAFDLQLTELGGVDATFTASSNGNTAGYLYNSEGILSARGSFTGETLKLRHLQSGTYTLVSMGQSMLFGNLTSIDDLHDVGLLEGTDYVATRVEITDGELLTVNVSDVPRMDDARFYYTSNTAYFNANKASVTAGNYITLQAHVDFKPEYAEKVNDVTLSIDLPDGCEMVENSVIANYQQVAHTVTGNRLTMTLNREQYGSPVRFCVMPTLNKNYSVTAMAIFDVDRQVQQPIGSAQFEAKGLSLRVPKSTADKKVTVNGTAKRYSEVSIYDNDVLIGKTTSKADGSWSAQCELYKPHNHSFHDIYAKITTEDGMKLTSVMRQVEYDMYQVVPAKVTMTYYNEFYKKHLDVQFSLLEGTTTPSSYLYTESDFDFTFLADFTRNDSTIIKNVNIIVQNNDGTVRNLPAVYDGTQNSWVATTNYSNSNRLPQNVKVEYIGLPVKAPFDSLQVYDDNNQFVNLIKNYVENVDTLSLAVLEHGKNMVVYQYKTLTMDNPVYIRVEQLEYDNQIMSLENSGYFTADNNGKTVCLKDSTMTDEHAMWIWSRDNKSLFQIELSQSNQFQSSFTFDKVSPSRRKSVFDNFTSIWQQIYSEINKYFKSWDSWKPPVDGLATLGCLYGQYDAFNSDLTSAYNYTNQLINERCQDGSLKLNEMNYIYFASELEGCNEAASLATKEFNNRLDKILVNITKHRNTSFMLGAALNMFHFTPIVMASRGFEKSESLDVDSLFDGAILFEIARNPYDMLINNQLYSLDELVKWYYFELNKIFNSYSVLQTNIINSCKKCKKEEDKENDEDFDGDGSTPLIDPSGFVYEAVLTNRLEGVTTTCYQQANGEAVVWNAEDYSQHNPLKTDATGFYRWDVPMGTWQVKYEKEGYETTYSEWLPVPPPQLDVNIGMRQSTPPTVKKMRGTESGITIDMSKYMLPTTMTAKNITVTRNGSAETGEVTMLNAESAPVSGESYVSKVKFVPQSHFHVDDNVVVTVHAAVESYAGIPMGKNHVETVEIIPELTAIVLDSALSVPYQGTKAISVVVLPKEAAAGRMVHMKSSSSMILAIDEENVEIDENGVATLMLHGRLPGGAMLSLTVDSTDMAATAKVQVVKDYDLVATPVASIQSGATVQGKVMLTLTCATDDATIYYTLDGSCPCDEERRIKYTEPFLLPTGYVTVKAIAVREDMDDSDVATFVYTIEMLKGDVDGNCSVDVADMVLLINKIMGIETPADYVTRMDMNGDGEYNVADVVLLKKAVLNAESNSSTKAWAKAVNIFDLSEFTAMQMDVTMPEGVGIEGIELLGENRQSHQIEYQQTGERKYRIIVYSMNNRRFSSFDGHVLTLLLSQSATDGVEIDDPLLVEPSGKRVQPSSFLPVEITGIADVVLSAEKAVYDVYDMSGKKVRSAGESLRSLEKGLYMINGKKEIIK